MQAKPVQTCFFAGGVPFRLKILTIKGMKVLQLAASCMRVTRTNISQSHHLTPTPAPVSRRDLAPTMRTAQHSRDLRGREPYGRHRNNVPPTQAKMNTTKSVSRPAPTPSSEEDWLPLAFASEIDHANTAQSKMLAKTHLFLRDFIPDSLTRRFAYIRGNYIMHHLFCHRGETVPSRHKVTNRRRESFEKAISLDGDC